MDLKITHICHDCIMSGRGKVELLVVPMDYKSMTLELSVGRCPNEAEHGGSLSAEQIEIVKRSTAVFGEVPNANSK